MNKNAIFSLCLVCATPMSLVAQDDGIAPELPGGTIAPAANSVSDAEAKAAEQIFQDGRKLFFQGKYREAVAKLTEAAKSNPEKTGYKLLLAKAHRYAEQGERAVVVLEAILKLDPDHVEAGIELAELLSPEKNPDRVIAVLEPLLKFKHDYPLYHLLAQAYYENEDFGQAREYFEEAIKLNARNADDHYQLGNIYLAQKRFAKAAREYETAGNLGLSSGAYHFKLASVYFNLRNFLGRVSTAEVIGGKVGEIKNDFYLIDEVPDKKDVFYVAGKQSSIFQVTKSRQLGIDLFELRFLEANTWLSARRYGKAEPLYAAIEEKVTEEDAGLYWYYRSETAMGLGKYKEYLAHLERAIDADPDVYKPTLADAYVKVAQRFHQRGDSASYIKYLEQAVETNPLSASVHLTLGDAHWLSSNRADAIGQYKLVLELEPDHPQRVRLLNRIRGQEEPG